MNDISLEKYCVHYDFHINFLSCHTLPRGNIHENIDTLKQNIEYIYIYRNIEIFRYWNIDVKIYWNIEIYIEIYVSILKYRYIEYTWKLKYWEKEILKYR